MMKQTTSTFTVFAALALLARCATSKPAEVKSPTCERWDPAQGTLVEVTCSGKDQDSDGLDDAADLCPDLPETRNGEQDQDGCPDPDADGDRVVDSADDCPQQAGPAPTGCPVLDSDGDGFADHLDSCPWDPEDLNGIEDQDGCPDGADQVVVTRNDQLFVQQPVHFLRRSAMLLPDSKDLLDRIVSQLSRHKTRISRIRVVGHCDPREVPKRKALALSKTRARMVARYLIYVGLDQALFEVESLGAAQPASKGRTARDREKNRRVELIITLKNQGQSTAVTTGDAGVDSAAPDAGATVTADAAQANVDGGQAQAQDAALNPDGVEPYREDEDWDNEFLDDDWDSKFIEK